MTFTNRLAAITPSQGTPVSKDSLFLKQAITLSGTSAQATTVPATGSFAPTISKGKLRVKLSAPAASGVSPAATIAITLTDGTNFVEVFRISTPVLAIGANTPLASMPNIEDRVQEFETDINATSMIVESTLTGTSPIMLMDVELAGTT